MTKTGFDNAIRIAVFVIAFLFFGYVIWISDAPGGTRAIIACAIFGGIFVLRKLVLDRIRARLPD